MIGSPFKRTLRQKFDLEGVPGLYGIVEFSPEDSTLPPQIDGPFCIWHDLQPKPKDFDDRGRPQEWIHISRKNDRNVEEPCNLRSDLTEGKLATLLQDGAKRVIAAQPPSPGNNGLVGRI